MKSKKKENNKQKPSVGEVKQDSLTKMDMTKSGQKPVVIWGGWRWICLLLAVGLSIGLVVGWAIELVYAPRVAYGLKLGSDELGGMTQAELNNYFSNKKEDILAGTGLMLDGQKVELKTLGEIGVWVDVDGCRDKIWAVGRQNNVLASYFNRAMVLTGGKKISCQLEFDEVDYNNFVNDLRDKYDEPAVSANVEKKDGELVVNSDKNGVVINDEILQADLYNNISVLNFADIKLSKITEEPLITQKDAEQARDLAKEEMANKMIWKYEDQEIAVDDSDVYGMLNFSQTSTDAGKKNMIEVSYDLASVDKFLNEKAGWYEDKPINPRLKMTTEGPVVVEEGQEGKMVNRAKLVDYLDKNIGTVKKEVDLPVEVMKSTLDTDHIEKLGIKELIATGSSNFSYSPTNRIHNISVGADKFDGTVIAPGEEFSFTTRLGSVDAANGYLPELVIADDETRPEYGGGLCQVSTTMYRAALNAGFPITDRTPHQYRVSYYEPAGQDATIYVPNPDLKFINDTKNYVMIEAVMDGSILRFNFYGSKDGREVTVTEPVIYNITSPPAPVYIYTSSLAAGEKVQVDSAHYGADSTFYRYIIYANGEKKEEEIFSRYQAWPAKYKVGEGEVTEKKTEETSESKDEKKVGDDDKKDNTGEQTTDTPTTEDNSTNSTNDNNSNDTKAVTEDQQVSGLLKEN